MSKIVLTYGTFDLFHNGHLQLLKRLRQLGDRLIVGVSTDEFNALKGKKTIIPFPERLEIVAALKYVDFAFAENCWEQKTRDIREHRVAVLGMGDDWRGKFDDYKPLCDVVYLPRTEGISSTQIKQSLSVLSRGHISEIKTSLDTIASIIENLG
ncbi:adenylyltransferase/cytidyltransferase family protein [Pseudomonas citronellolis]|uniref:adenylyltransferase/cytidyltransferase family protein n=1 Tax=Pseudomonas citronellolis TaxID=53408 RepID=UPI0023E36AAA|nr:adenylyltransferase/cytidyltransferase family protein [Pseudomonas citronellolis]MDF3932263.1 adenylyltransferase/cytidyltransferase family protein [Pseudomonas citronellolis]